MQSDAATLDATVIVPSHRGEHRLPALLEAFSRQDTDRAWELLIVVDGVLDSTPDLLDSWRERLPQLRVLVHETPQGVVAAMNLGYREARGEYLIRCDDDLDPGPDFVAGHVAAHGGRTDIGVIGPTPDVFPDTPYARVYGRPAAQRSVAGIYARPAELRWIHWAANNSVHRDALEAVGGFDPRFVYGQDSELGYRLTQQGVELRVEATVEAPHRGPSTTAATRVPRAVISGASRRLFYQVHPETVATPPTPQGIKARAWHLATSSMATALRSHGAWRRVGALLDRAIPVLPTAVAGRLVALCVEAAGLSGLQHGNPDLAVYKAQKQAELQRERWRNQ